MEYLSSPQQMEDFKRTTIYVDFINELKVRIEMLRDQLEETGYTDNEGKQHTYKGSDYDLFRGGITNMRQMVDIFDNMKENIIADREAEAEKVPE